MNRRTRYLTLAAINAVSAAVFLATGHAIGVFLCAALSVFCLRTAKRHRPGDPE